MKKTFDLICSVRELTGIFNTKTNVRGLLKIVVKIIAKHMQTAACSIFLLDNTTNELVLSATAGLNPDFIGKIRLSPGEGITGRAMKERRPVNIPRGSEDPSYKYIPGMDEEQYNSILAVPILYQSEILGVLILEDPSPDYYNNHDVKSLQTITSQLATFLENARSLIQLDKKGGKISKKRSNLKKSFYKGTSVSEGLAIGNALYLSDANNDIFLKIENVKYNETPEAFEQALLASIDQLEILQQRMDESLSEAGSLIFASHLLMMSDDDFSGSIRKYIQDGEKPSLSIVKVVNEYIELFMKSNNIHVQEKILDLKDIGHRLLRNLTGKMNLDGDYTGQIIIARDLLPSELVKLAAQHTEGFILFGAGVTSHISILARSLDVPVIFISDQEFFRSEYDGLLIVDAFQSNVIINPDSELVDKYLANLKNLKARNNLQGSIIEAAVTRDGKKIKVQANINILSDARSAKELKAEGVGLYRSEFLFLIRNDFPSEEEQFIIYRKLLEQMDDVVFRTLDIGGDKILGVAENQETNPFMGLRGLRYSLRNPDIFKIQLRALLRAGAGYSLKILFPLITGVEDFREASGIVGAVLEELKAEGMYCAENPAIGAMIELPSAVMMVDELAEEADFLSIGTNDLVQYMLGIDRDNDDIADLYIANHPAVLRALKKISIAADKYDCPLSVCGNASADPDMLEFFIGLGISTFSINHSMIQFVRRQICEIDYSKAKFFSGKSLRTRTVKDVHNIIAEKQSKIRN
ncbi:MAG: phosphoenolpyruvate--protein phosphotransferase [Spirochaetales bacterium]|nr:phosphoenolpyruvate--protein phosphotransferase [Spirochaetales bacterium]